MSYALSGLEFSEAQADSAYSLPAGTMEALGETESSQGTNLGSIGNVFQITPATAADPGYGLPTLDGNSPMDAASYLSALMMGPGQGSLATALAMYQGGPANPVPYASTSPIGQFLSSLGGEYYGGTNETTQSGPGSYSSAVVAGAAETAATNNPTSCGLLDFGCKLTMASNYIASKSVPIVFVIIGVVLIAGALLMFALRSINDA